MSEEKPTTAEVEEQNSEEDVIEADAIIDNSLQAELDAAKEEAEKNLEGQRRILAEFQNYKRRTERERQELTTKTALETITKILPIIDDFERAMANLPDDLNGHPWMNGVALIQSKFKKLLDEHDITVIQPDGEAFDPNLHQAITMDDSDDVESGHVIETLLKGYQSGDILLRPAMVRVAN